MLGRNQNDFNAEVQAHLAEEADELRRQGLDADAARHAAERAFGNVTRVQERFYESRHWMPLENLWRDLRLAFRMLRRSPSFTLAAVATLAMAIAANAVVFAAINAVVLHPLPLPHTGTLYSLQWKSDGYGADSYPNYRDLRDRNRSFTSLAAYSVDETALATPAGTPSSVWLYAVSGNYFQTLGVRAYFGRLLRPA
ncbi:MAG: permease prefix domain 1-containing protein, partial [Terriglobales bacterium]